MPSPRFSVQPFWLPSSGAATSSPGGNRYVNRFPTPQRHELRAVYTRPVTADGGEIGYWLANVGPNNSYLHKLVIDLLPCNSGKTSIRARGFMGDANSPIFDKKRSTVNNALGYHFLLIVGFLLSSPLFSEEYLEFIPGTFENFLHEITRNGKLSVTQRESVNVYTSSLDEVRFTHILPSDALFWGSLLYGYQLGQCGDKWIIDPDDSIQKIRVSDADLENVKLKQDILAAINQLFVDKINAKKFALPDSNGPHIEMIGEEKDICHAVFIIKSIICHNKKSDKIYNKLTKQINVKVENENIIQIAKKFSAALGVTFIPDPRIIAADKPEILSGEFKKFDELNRLLNNNNICYDIGHGAVYYYPKGHPIINREYSIYTYMKHRNLVKDIDLEKQKYQSIDCETQITRVNDNSILIISTNVVIEGIIDDLEKIK